VAVAVGWARLLPPLSPCGALVARPYLRSHLPRIEPRVRISRTALSDKTSRLRPRHVVSKPGQTHEPKGLVEVREWIAAVLASSGLVLEAQPPTQPHSRIVVERPIRRSDGPYCEVVRPSAQRAVQQAYQLCGFLPRTCSDGQLVDLFDHALDALL